MATVNIKDWVSWDRAWQGTQKNHSEANKVIQKWNAKAQTFAANTLGNAGQKRTQQVIQ